MVDPVNLNIPGLDYLFFALVFFAVVALLTLVLAPVEILTQHSRRARATEGGTLLESRRIEGRLEWITVQRQNAVQQVRDRRTRQQPLAHPGDLIEEAED